MPALTYTAASSSYIANSSWAIVELWGGGGAGAGATGNPSAGGGGAGGQYVRSVYYTVVGIEYTASIGQTVSGSTTNTVNGNDSSFFRTDGGLGEFAVAKGGAGASPIITNNGSGLGASGSTANGVGDTIVAGGNGGDALDGTPTPTISGGGGGGGGGNAFEGTGGIATAPGGDGGDGRTNDGAGNTGNTYGGGGGGAYASSATDRVGGNGRAGYGRIYFSPPAFLCCLGCG
jgi:hypothetical protein